MLLRSLSLFSYRDYEFRFNPELPFIKQETKYYYRNIFYNRAESHLEDLKYCFLQVGLIPAPEPQHSGHQIRISTRDNPSWYSELYQSFSKERVRKNGRLKWESTIKRQGVEKALERIIEHDSSSYPYDILLREEVFRSLVCRESRNVEFFSRYLISCPEDDIPF